MNRRAFILSVVAGVAALKSVPDEPKTIEEVLGPCKMSDVPEYRVYSADRIHPVITLGRRITL